MFEFKSQYFRIKICLKGFKMFDYNKKLSEIIKLFKFK